MDISQRRRLTRAKSMFSPEIARPFFRAGADFGSELWPCVIESKLCTKHPVRSKDYGYRLIHPTFLKATSDRECCPQCEREQTEKQEASSILTDSRQNHRLMLGLAHVCNHLQMDSCLLQTAGSLHPRGALRGIKLFDPAGGGKGKC